MLLDKFPSHHLVVALAATGRQRPVTATLQGLSLGLSPLIFEVLQVSHDADFRPNRRAQASSYHILVNTRPY